MFLKRELAFVFFATFICLSFASAIGVTRTNLSDTSAAINIDSASNLYAYEVAFDYSGTPNSPTFASFLGSGTVSGTLNRNNVFSVYESKQDGTTTGVTGSGNIFNITFTGSLAFRYLLAVYGDGTSEYVYYNNSASNNATGGGGGNTGGGGGGGSSGGGASPSIDLSLVQIVTSVPELAISTVAGRSFTREVKVRNDGSISVTLDIAQTGFRDLNFEKSITLDAGEEKTLLLSFGPVDKGLITGILNFTVRGVTVYELPIVINTRSENFLFDSLLTLSDDSKIARPGDTIRAQVNLEQVARQSEQVDVVASYIIKDFYGATFLEEKETFSLIDSKEYEKEFLLPSDIKPGKYILGMEITYPGAFATASAQFEVPAPFWSLNATTIFIVVFTVFALALGIVIIWAIIRNRSLGVGKSVSYGGRRKNGKK